MANKNFADKLKKSPQTVIDIPKNNPVTETKKKPGRPKTKTEPTKTINIAIPISVLNQVEIAKYLISKGEKVAIIS